MSRREGRNCFDLDNQNIVDNNICKKISNDNAFIKNLNGLLQISFKACSQQLDLKRLLINSFKKSKTQSAMHFHRQPNYFSRQVKFWFHKIL